MPQEGLQRWDVHRIYSLQTETRRNEKQDWFPPELLTVRITHTCQVLREEYNTRERERKLERRCENFKNTNSNENETNMRETRIKSAAERTQKLVRRTPRTGTNQKKKKKREEERREKRDGGERRNTEPSHLGGPECHP
jgi:hypothetical protein